MTEKPVLTISLLCSGRKETKKCLDSLENLRKKVSNELILIDTGCDEETGKLLYTYTNYVIPFVWCDDFSKARNTGLEKAQGEWFMFLDDDESFLNTKEIEDFFMSGDYRNYGYASYTVRNYLDKDGFTYEDSLPVRLCCLRQETRFRGIIHEVLTPLVGNGKHLNSIAEHFGYVYRTIEEERKHSERNRELLQRELAEDAEDIRIWTHLAQEYRAVKDYRTLREFCTEALQKFENKNNDEVNRERGCFYCSLLEADIGLENYEIAEKDYKNALSDKRNTEYCIARLMTLGAEIFEHCGKKEQMKECCHRYFALREYYRTRLEELRSQDTFFVRLAFHPVIENNMYSYQICLDLEQKDTGSLKKYFDDFGWENRRVYMTEEFMSCLVKAMAKLPYEEIFVHVAEVLANRPGMVNFWEEIEKIEGEAEVGQLVRIFSEIGVGIAGEIAVSLRKMLQTEREDDWEGFSDSLKEAVGIYPMLGGLLKRYARSYAERRMKMNEMQALAAQVKAQVRVLFSQGMRKEALQVLEQLQNLTPDDAELEELMQILNEQNSVTMKPVAE